MSQRELWNRYKKHLCVCESIGLSLDVSRMKFDDQFFERMTEPMNRAFDAVKELEAGAIANPDENRMVGHYWLRNPDLAPDSEIAYAIRSTLSDILQFTRRVHDGEIRPPKANRFTRHLVVGIGGSALGPQFVADALTSLRDRMAPHFFDNTDPDGIDRTLAKLDGTLDETLTIVISKSGGTKETRNGMLEARTAFEAAGLAIERKDVVGTTWLEYIEERTQATSKSSPSTTSLTPTPTPTSSNTTAPTAPSKAPSNPAKASSRSTATPSAPLAPRTRPKSAGPTPGPRSSSSPPASSPPWTPPPAISATPSRRSSSAPPSPNLPMTT